MGRDRAFAEVRDQLDRWVIQEDAASLGRFLAARAAGRDDDSSAFFFRGYVHGVAARLGVTLPTVRASAGAPPVPRAALLADIDAHAAAFTAFARGYLDGWRPR